MAPLVRAAQWPLVLLTVLLALAGCSSLPTPPGPSSRSSVNASIATPRSASPSSSPATAAVHGVLLLDQSGLNSDPQSTSLQIVDPDSGTVELTRRWSAPSGVELGTYTRESYPGQYDHLISPDYNYLAASQSQSDGTIVAGVLATDGSFVNVSAPVTKGGFSGELSTNREMFAGDRFYFNAYLPRKSDDTVYSVPVARIGADKLTAGDFKVELKGDEALSNFVVGPDGRVSVSASCEKTPWGFAHSATSLLGKDGYVSLDGNKLLRYNYSKKCSLDPGDGRSLIPTTTQQLSEAVISPDTSQILLQVSQGSTVSYYRVASTGGQPTILNYPSGRPATWILAGWR